MSTKKIKKGQTFRFTPFSLHFAKYTIKGGISVLLGEKKKAQVT